MRIYELAKKVHASSIEVLNKAKSLGIEADSSLTQLASPDEKRLREAFAKRTAADIEQASAARTALLSEKHKKAATRRTDASKTERSTLEGSRKLSLEMDASKKGGTPSPEGGPTAEPPPEKPEPEALKAEPEAPQPKTPEQPEPREVKTESEPAPTPAAPAPKAPPPPAQPPAPKAPAPPAQPPTPAAPKPLRPKGPRAEDDSEPIDERAAPFIGKFAKADPAPRGTPQRPTRPPPPRPGAPRPGGFRPPQGAAPWPPRGVPPPNGPRNGFQRPPAGGPPPQAPTQPPPDTSVPPDRLILLRGAVLVKDLADQLGLRPNRLIADLMQLNILASINQRVEVDVAQKIAEKYGYKIEIERQKRSTERKPVMRSEDADDAIPEDKPEDLQPRPPVVTFLGHVDHGKTSLMDRIRNTRVASGEAGGITQHIGAYTVEISGRKITFLDTPGHAAFSAMRARGASLTDIAVIIIAADDGIMPQTREVIRQAQQAGVQIMVAINKCDLPTAKPDRVRQMLQGEGLTPEEWGGDLICAEVSAHTGEGVDHLLEMILLQADVMELTANPLRRANGYVIEAQLEQGLGPTGTLLVTGGTLSVGDIVLCGEHVGKIRGLIDDRGRRVKSAGPATAVKCMGLSGVPEAGAEFRVMLNEKRARDLAERTTVERKQVELSSSKATSLDALMSQMKGSQRRELAVIVKADTQGSSEAIVEALKNIKSEKVSLNIISEGIGNASATDVNKASAGKALVLGFSVSCDTGVQQLARHVGVRVSTFRIIYELIDFVKQRMLDLLSPEYKEVIRGHAEIRAAFDIGKTGRVAGCQLLDGVLRADARYRVFRKKEKLWDGKLSSLKHFQNEVAEVSGSQECGIFFNGFEAFQVGDIIECYALEELPRTL